jgi:DNA-binding SARP family transcriptional activator
VTGDMLKGMIDTATEAYAKAQELHSSDAAVSPDDAAKTLADVVALGEKIGVTAS